jgi:hypothetical protein
VKRLLSGSVSGAAFDAGSVDDPGLIDWFVAQGEQRRLRSDG